MPDYGTDVSCVTDIDPSFRIVSGPEMMAQVCVRRLSCRKGSLLSDPLYGIDLRDFLGGRTTGAVIASLAQGELINDERISDIQVSATVTGKSLTLHIKGTGAVGPFALVITATPGALSSQILKS